MSKLLVIDTSASICGVGLANSGTWTQLEAHTPRQAAQEMLGLVDALLTQSGLKLAQLDAIAITSGPGSFTGLRIGIGIAQGLAESASVPLIPLSNLALCAYSHLKKSQASGAIVCFAARDEESYWAQYLICDQLGVKLQGVEKALAHHDQKLALNAVADLSHWILVGDGWDDALLTSHLSSMPGNYEDIRINLNDACELAAKHLAAGLLIKPEQVTPNYVKEELDYLS